MFKKLINICLVLPLGACSFVGGYLGGETGLLRDRSADYATAPMLPAMSIPGELDSYTIEQLYVIPEQIFVASTVFDAIPMPRPIEANRREGVIIQNLGDRRWIVLDASPAQVWPLIRDYWRQLGVVLDFENASAGVMETSWLEIGDDSGNRHKYRVTIEPGLHSGYSEIYVLHTQGLRSEPTPTATSWPDTSSSEDMERQILTLVSQYLADRNDAYQASTSSLLAGSIEGEGKANILENELGDQFLELRIGYNRAWVQVRQALEKADIAIVDSDRDESYFNVKFAGNAEEDDVGFIRRLFGSNRTPVTEKDFNIRLQQTDSVVNVIAEGPERSEETTVLNEELLRAIIDNMS
jgi:outer membrane protein assembly factor BamC